MFLNNFGFGGISMKLLIYDACSFTTDDIWNILRAHHVECRYVLYRPTDLHKDDFFEYRIRQYLKETAFDAIFSINYYPVLAKLCFEHRIKYIAWSYDSPLIIPNIEESLQFPTTYFFVFDRTDYEKYQQKGFTNVYHLPLAVNVTRLSSLHSSLKDQEHFSCDVSLLGQIYESVLPQLLFPLDDYSKGYIHALVNSQLSVYGSYFVDELLTDELLETINHAYRQLGQNGVSLEKHGLSAAIAKQITRTERITLLDTLGTLCKTSYYAHAKEPEISHATYRGSVNYYQEMYKVFQCSKVNLNPTLKSIISGIPLRALDIMGCGGFLLSNYQPELAEYFTDGEELALYTSPEDAIEKALFYLSNEDLRLSVAKKGQLAVFSNFSYEKQLARLFSVCMPEEKNLI